MRSHHPSEELLLEYAEGTLDPDQWEEVAEHLQHCDDCRSWPETYDLLVESVGRESSRQSHLSSDQLCTFALTPEALERSARDQAARHQAECDSCAQEIEMVRASVGKRKESPPLMPATAVKRSNRGQIGLALAAALIAVIGVAVMTRTPAAPPLDVALQGGLLEGEETVDAVRSIHLGNTEIASGAEVTLQSESVAFGNGFSIEDSASLIVVTNLVPLDG
jgi:hypothetical protein